MTGRADSHEICNTFINILLYRIGFATIGPENCRLNPKLQNNVDDNTFSLL